MGPALCQLQLMHDKKNLSVIATRIQDMQIYRVHASAAIETELSVIACFETQAGSA